MKVAFLLSLSVVAVAQSISGGGAQINAPCSAVNGGTTATFNFTCSGLTPAQQKLLENMPALLNRLLSSPPDNLATILAPLNTCMENVLRYSSGKPEVSIVQTGPRSISAVQKQKLIAALSNPPGKPEIRIKVATSNAEASRFARQLRDIFSSTPGWTVPPLSEAEVSGAPTPPNLVAYVQNEANVYGFGLRRIFTDLGFKLEFVIDPKLSPELVVLAVGETGKP